MRTTTNSDQFPENLDIYRPKPGKAKLLILKRGLPLFPRSYRRAIARRPVVFAFADLSCAPPELAGPASFDLDLVRWVAGLSSVVGVACGYHEDAQQMVFAKMAATRRAAVVVYTDASRRADWWAALLPNLKPKTDTFDVIGEGETDYVSPWR